MIIRRITAGNIFAVVKPFNANISIIGNFVLFVKSSIVFRIMFNLFRERIFLYWVKFFVFDLRVGCTSEMRCRHLSTNHYWCNVNHPLLPAKTPKVISKCCTYFIAQMQVTVFSDSSFILYEISLLLSYANLITVVPNVMVPLSTLPSYKGKEIKWYKITTILTLKHIITQMSQCFCDAD